MTLPRPPSAVGLYEPSCQIGDLIYTSGQGPIVDGRPAFVGKVGRDLGVDEAKQAARICILNALAILNDRLGDLDKVRQVVKVLGFVASADGFTEQPAVMDGASELLIEVFGERGRHARSAIGTSQLPGDIPVEIELICRVSD